MKRSATDVLRRGFNLVVANWPLIAIRIAESILLLMIVVGAVIATIAPIAISAGLGNLNDVTSAASAILSHWLLIVYALIVVSVLLVILVAIHAFVDGGIAQIYVDSERNGAQPSFNINRMLTGGRSAWWAIFWIYNIVWSIAGIILLVPLIATLAGTVAVADNTGRIVIACAGLAITILVLLPIAIVAAIWTQKAIAVCVARNAPATEAMRIARHDIRADLGRHFVVAFIVLVVSIGAAGLISVVSLPISLMSQHQPLMVAVTAPMQIVVSFAQTIVSAATGAWLLASFVALTEER